MTGRVRSGPFAPVIQASNCSDCDMILVFVKGSKPPLTGSTSHPNCADRYSAGHSKRLEVPVSGGDDRVRIGAPDNGPCPGLVCSEMKWFMAACAFTIHPSPPGEDASPPVVPICQNGAEIIRQTRCVESDSPSAPSFFADACCDQSEAD